MPDVSALENAYALKTPDDNRAHYDDWSENYDNEFIDGYGYVAPAKIAALFTERFKGGGTVLDIGAGTGALADHLPGMTIDGIDISPNMLAVARNKGRYRDLIEADLTKPLPLKDACYKGFVSSGTFTHGHVGPGCLEELLRIASPDALFCLGTNALVFDEAGFGSVFARITAHGRITPVDFAEFAIYESAGHSHADDKGLAAIFRKR